MQATKVNGNIKARKSSRDKKGALASPAQESLSINLNLDNSLRQFANDKFVVAHAKKVDEKFAAK